MRIIAVVGVLAIASGCAFRSDSDPASQADPIVANDGRIAGVHLSWEGLKDPIDVPSGELKARDTGTWAREKAISLPVVLPEQTQWRIDFACDPQQLGGVSVNIVATTGETPDEKLLSAYGLEVAQSDAAATLSFKVADLKTLLAADREQLVFLRFKFVLSNKQVRQLLVAVTTPPSRLPIVGGAYVYGGSGPVEGLPGALRSQAEQRDLVAWARLRNDSFEQVRISVPFRNTAKLQFPKTHYTIDTDTAPNPHVIRHIQSQETVNEEVEHDFFIYPASSDLQVIWPGIDQNRMSSLLIAPGQTLTLGLYTSSTLVTRLAERPVEEPTKTQASVDANARCLANRIPAPPQPGADNGAWYCDAINQNWHFPADATATCRQVIPAMRNCVASGGKPIYCNAAALLDDQVDQQRKPHPDNGIPWPMWMGCRLYDMTGDGHISYIHLGWIWDAVNAEFLEGNHSLPVTTKWDDEVIPMTLRFSTGNQGADGEARSLPLYQRLTLRQ